MSNTRTQLLLILAGVFIGILIYLAPRSKGVDKKEESELSSSVSEQEEHQHSIENTAETAVDLLKKLDEEEKEKLAYLEEKAEKIADTERKLTLYDSLIEFSIKNNLPPLVAKYTARKAMAVPTEVNWMLSGDNYFKAFRLSKEKNKNLIEKAIESYQNVLELNPNNLEAETAIGVAYVEGSAQLGEMPMKGIGILKEVLNKDPKNVNALTNLGYFAIQSGQYEKAIERFKTVLSIDPKNAEAYIYLTDIYLSQNKVDQGIETLEKYKSLVDDPLVKKQVDDYIKEIRNK